MPQLRYSRDCDWHVFEEVKTGETGSRLAVWHKDLEAQGASSLVIMTQKMLELEDYFSITRYLPHHERTLHDAFDAWLSEQSGVENRLPILFHQLGGAHVNMDQSDPEKVESFRFILSGDAPDCLAQRVA